MWHVEVIANSDLQQFCWTCRLSYVIKARLTSCFLSTSLRPYRLQELLIYRYEQAPWEKVEALEEDEIKFEDVDESKHMA